MGGFRPVPEAAAGVSLKATLYTNSGGFSSIGSNTSVTAVRGLGVGASAIRVVGPEGAGYGFGTRTDSFPLSAHGKFGIRFSSSPCPDKSYYFSIYTHLYTLTYTCTHTHTHRVSHLFCPCRHYVLMNPARFKYTYSQPLAHIHAHLWNVTNNICGYANINTNTYIHIVYVT